MVVGLFVPLVLGMDWLQENGIIIDCGKNFVYIGKEEEISKEE